MKWVVITLLIVAVVCFFEFLFSVFSYPSNNNIKTENDDDENNGFMFPF